VEEATWEREDALKKEFPYLFRSQPNLEDEIHFKWGRFVTPAFLSYLNCVTNHSLKNLLNLFRRLSSRSPPPDFLPFRHRAVSSSFSVEPPAPFPFPLAPPSRYITIVSWSAACAYPAAIVGAARVSYPFLSHILLKSILFLSSNFFFPRPFFLRWLPLSFSPLCCLLPARAVARSLRTRADQRTTHRCPHCWPCTRARITPPASRQGRCYLLCRCVPASRARQAGVRPVAMPARLRPVPSPSQLALCPRASRPPLMARLLYCR
jgi:hypothetical protein